ncbi:ABC transporter G family member 7 [Camellia lanceoleosa]|uniref:ABC transporter G family member 7 n=1 Tax=Camellia lanceoleosa TaxID=1840588 RepID=A0ACC0G236_9ERIC|nr:ABC transporter G family member 7 [Camellia lanceoleosa]
MNHWHTSQNLGIASEHVNPAEFLADLISIDYSSAESVYFSCKRIDGLVESFSQQRSSILYATPLVRRETSKNSMNLRKKTIVKKKGGWWRQFWLLLNAAWMQASRWAYKQSSGKDVNCISYYFWVCFLEDGKISVFNTGQNGIASGCCYKYCNGFLTKTGVCFPRNV